MAAFSSRGPGRLLHQARHHRARRADPRRPHARPRRRRRAARPASTSRRSPGTSMSSPHIAGSAHPAQGAAPDVDAGPDQVGADDDGDHRGRSRRTCATPADPFDIGAGRIDLDVGRQRRADLRRDRGADGRRSGNDPVNAVHLNLPSVNAPVHAGPADHDPDGDERDRQRRSATRSTTTAPPGTSITVSPTSVHAAARRSRSSSTITITTDGAAGPVLRRDRPRRRAASGVADAAPAGGVRPQQGEVTPDQLLRPGTIDRGSRDRATCTVTAPEQRVRRHRPST